MLHINRLIQGFASLVLCLFVLVLLPKVCLAQAGTLDNTFGTDGKVTTGGDWDRAYSVAIQADGKIVVVGPTTGSLPDFALVRYNTDGTLDNTFGTGGKVTTDFNGLHDFAYSVAIQADGKIVVVGRSFWDFGLARYNADGSLDTFFGTGGKVTTDFFDGNFDEANSVAIQADGKIIVVGQADVSGNFVDLDFALARYNADGSLDTVFGTGGKVTTDFYHLKDGANSVAIQTDGKIVVAGQGSNIRPTYADFALARYNANGTLDNTFGTGEVTTDFHGYNDGANSVVIQADGKIVVTGGARISRTNVDVALVRYNTDGSLDTFFGTGGKVTNGGYSANSMAIQTDGKIVVAGYAYISGNYDFALARYNANGTLDNTFGTGGKVTTDFNGLYDSALSMAIQADSKIVVAGYANISGNSVIALARYIGVTSPQEAINLFIEDTQDLVASGSLNNGQGNALQKKLQGAIQQLDSGKTTPAVNNLNAFINQVEGFINGGTLTSAEGQPLIDAAQAIIDLINASSRMAQTTLTGFTTAQDVTLPEHYALHPNYPNPFNPVTTLAFDVPETSHVKLVVYDMLGQVVRVLVDGAMPAGRHEATFEAGDLPSGLYMARLVTVQGTFTEKMLLLK